MFISTRVRKNWEGMRIIGELEFFIYIINRGLEKCENMLKELLTKRKSS